MKNKRILVTGGAGFIGSHIVERFYKDNEVIVIDNLSSGKRRNLPNILRNKIYKYDIVKDDIKRLFQDIDYVFHCAANVLVDESLEDPVHDAMTNVIGLINVLETCRTYNVKRLIWCSSSAIYGEPDEVPIKEDAKFKPDSPYAVSKTSGEYYCDLYNQLYGLEIVKLRYFNAYGERQDTVNPYSGVIAVFADRCLKGLPITIHGTGEQTRDFVHVSDIARANELAINCPTGAYNIGTGVETSIKDLAHIIRDIVYDVDDVASEINYGKGRLGDVMKDHADTSLAKEVLNFKSEIELIQGLRKYLQWLKFY